MNRKTLLTISLMWPHAGLALLLFLYIITGNIPEIHHLIFLLLPGFIALVAYLARK